MRRLSIFFVLTLGCGGDSDVGKSCPMSVPAATSEQPEASSIDFPTYVEINTEFPCASMVCVAATGRSPYCSLECRSDDGCPQSFECRVVTETGPLAGKRYCVWRYCQVQLECGDVKKYDCLAGDFGPSAPPGMCGPIGSGSTL